MSRITEADAHYIQACLHDFSERVPGLEGTVVASVDGFSLAAVTQRNADNGDRLAAMTSSMLALANAVGRELALGELEVLIIDASMGKVLMLSIPKIHPPLLLMAACNQSSITGGVLWQAKECGHKIRDYLAKHNPAMVSDAAAEAIAKPVKTPTPKPNQNPISAATQKPTAAQVQPPISVQAPTQAPTQQIQAAQERAMASIPSPNTVQNPTQETPPKAVPNPKPAVEMTQIGKKVVIP